MKTLGIDFKQLRTAVDWSVQPSPAGVTNNILNGSGTNLYSFGPGTTLFLRHDATNAFVLR